MPVDWTMALGLVVTSSLIAGAAMLAVSALGQRAGASNSSIFTAKTPSIVYLFDGELLVDATPPARALLLGSDPRAPDHCWFQLLARLEPLFPGLSLRLEGVSREGRFVLCSHENVEPPLVLRAEWLSGLIRITLIYSGEEAAHPGSDGATELALSEELLALRETLAQAPLPIWRESPLGDVVWANGAYLEAAVATLAPDKELGWPLPALFPNVAAEQMAAQMAPRQPRTPPSRRHAVSTDTGNQWYEVHVLMEREVALCYALPLDQVVRAEAGLQEFKQTLAKTFAQLPVGLAIFDSARVLQMFNPALVDLTNLSTSFLVARPKLPALLDALREGKMIPEPRDYRSWRQRIVQMESAAASGLFEETWTLPSGQTWRVTGRPHPNGALAFLIEDISTEMSRTRRYRADLELGQSVMDAIPDAMVVFARDGTAVLANATATSLWGLGFPGMPAHGDDGVIALWRERTAPTLLWSDLAEYIGSFAAREPWEGDLRLIDGRGLECRVSPLPHGATLVWFRPPPRIEASLDPGQAVMFG